MSLSLSTLVMMYVCMSVIVTTQEKGWFGILLVPTLTGSLFTGAYAYITFWNQF